MANYSKCTNCGGEEYFNPETGILVCDRCGSTFPVKEGAGSFVRRNYDSSYSLNGNRNEVVRYSCMTCGAKSVVGTDGEVKKCASCGNTTLKKEKSTTIVPDGIIPFAVSRRKAAEIFRNWAGTRKFAPSDLKQMAKLEKISGLYTPVWNFNFTSIFRYNGTAIKIKTDSDGNQDVREIDLDKVKETRHSNILISASTRITNDFLEGMGDYDFNKVRPYSTDFLLGFAGIDTDVDIHNIYSDMTNDIAKENKRKMKIRLAKEYDNIDEVTYTTRFRDVSFNYTHVPVWANHYSYKGKEYHCYINGQTGKATGRAPKSILKIGGLILGILAGIGAVVGLIISLL